METVTPKLEISELEDLLNNMYTDEGKERLIFKAVEKGLIDDPSYIETAIQSYEKRWCTDDVAEFAFQKSGVCRAIEVWTKQGDINGAIKFAREKGALWKVIEFCKETGKFDEAGCLLEERKDYDLAFKLYEENEMFEEAAKVIEHIQPKNKELINSLRRKAIEKYESLGKYDAAGNVAEALGEIDKALDYYVKSGDCTYLCYAGSLAKENGKYERAKEVYMTAMILSWGQENHYHLNDIINNSGFPILELEFWKKVGDFYKAVECAEKLGKIDDAIDLAKEHTNPKCIAELAKKAIDDHPSYYPHYYRKRPFMEYVDLAIENYDKSCEVGEIANLLEIKLKTLNVRLKDESVVDKQNNIKNDVEYCSKKLEVYQKIVDILK
jgi:tetratricopeptide (TPR) repeat protein